MLNTNSNLLSKDDVIAFAQVSGGAYLGYQGLKHGLPRMAGIRIEYHTTCKKNAESIKASGNFLDPDCGGKSGWAEKVGSDYFKNNSKGFVHITGMHENSNVSQALKERKIPKFFRNFVGTCLRKISNIMYYSVGNAKLGDMKDFNKNSGNIKSIKWIIKEYIKNVFANRTKVFCIPGIDSYFDKNFMPDCDSDAALKTPKKVKVFSNRFSAAIEGLKTFGVSGIKENKSRVLFGTGIVFGGIYAGNKLITDGINKLKQSNSLLVSNLKSK